MSALTHLDEDGRPRMVDVAAKSETARAATAEGRVRLSASAFAIALQDNPKGDVRRIAELAGVMAAKKTSDLIPLCHPLMITSATVDVVAAQCQSCFIVTARVGTTGQTGVEMEAMTAVSVACLTLYDMLKAIDKGIVIEAVRLLEKTGGKSGDWRADE
jgi:cyclic pyranopterin phosphate synthase